MTLVSRPFQTEDDLFAMQRLLIAGRRAANGTYYIHTGDLLWWYTYILPDQDPRRFTTLWEFDPPAPGGLAAWSLFSPAWHALDVFIHPELHGAPQAMEIWIQAEEMAAAQMRLSQSKTLRTLWIAEEDEWTVAHLLGRGFLAGRDWMDVMVRALDEPVNLPRLPDGFTLRPPDGAHEAALRAAPQYAAFGSSLPPEDYVARYTRFMDHPCYPAGFDVMAIAPDGRAAAFCIAWLDAVNRVGLFEPVGVHPDFQRQGLGRVIVSEGLRRLQLAGMQQALVCGLSDLPEARAFYTGLGFEPVLRLRTFQKSL